MTIYPHLVERPACAFCAIAQGEAPAHVIHASDDILAFSDINPIRPGHTQIIPRQHFEVFDDLPADLALSILKLAQRIARAQKRVYGVDRVGFVFSGFDVPHAHAHVIPLHQPTDLTSMRYFALGSNLPLRETEPAAEALQDTARVLSEALECATL